jgi:outer membrane protein OmpA-like peptidoglycan-associated protein
VILAVCLFLTGALFGIYMFYRHLKRRAIPAWSAVVHGAFGATAFAIVLFLLVRTPESALLRTVIGILVGAVVLGVVNLLFHIRRVRHRTILIVFHALTAVSGVGTLAYGAIFPAPVESPGPAPSGVPGPARPGPEVASADTARPTTPAGTATSTGTPTAATTASASAGAASAVAAATPPAPPGIRPGAAWADHTLTFDNASATLDDTDRAALSGVAKELSGHPEVKLVEVQGYADERGDDGINLQLTRARASAAVEFLVANGVARTRLRGAGYGSRCPADPACQGAGGPASCHDPSSLQHDRRVAFVVLESGSEQYHGKVACERGMSLAPREDQRYAAGP